MFTFIFSRTQTNNIINDYNYNTLRPWHMCHRDGCCCCWWPRAVYSQVRNYAIIAIDLYHLYKIYIIIIIHHIYLSLINYLWTVRSLSNDMYIRIYVEYGLYINMSHIIYIMYMIATTRLRTFACFTAHFQLKKHNSIAHTFSFSYFNRLRTVCSVIMLFSGFFTFFISILYTSKIWILLLI